MRVKKLTVPAALPASLKKDKPRQGWQALLPVLVLGAYLVSLLVRFAHRGNLYLSFFVDDFFYYVVVAKNLATHGTSTFNGLQATNGYHPLWLWTLTLIYKLFGNHRSFFVALVLLIWLLVLGGYRALRQAQHALGIDPAAGLPFALISITLMAIVSRSGMEVGLALFLLVLLWGRFAAQPLEGQTPADAFLSGVLASALILSRLDTSLIVAVYGALTLIWPSGPRRRALLQILYFAVGLAPVALYLAANRFVFGVFLPVSGLVKNLKTGWLPTDSVTSILQIPRMLNIVFVWPAFAVCLLFLLLLLRPRPIANAVRPAQRRVQLCVALHPFVFYGVLSFTSDWPMWWIWYLYPLVPVWALLGPDLLHRWAPRSRRASPWLAAAVAAGSLLIFVDRLRTNTPAVYALERATSLQQFAAAHPGRYGIGDAAGMGSYLMPAPVVQLEGLVGDKTYLQRIRQQQPLLQAMADLGVDYYVTVRGDLKGNCYDVREPAQSGPRSPAMHASLCVKPVAEIRPPGDPHRALIFDLHQLNPGPQAKK